MESLVSRDEILDAIVGALEPRPFVLALWEAGAAAFGRIDLWSDLDINVVAEDEHVEAVFELVEEACEELAGLEHRYRLPEPTWHGHSQAFYALRRASPYHLVDFVVMKRSSTTDRFLEPERHGEAVVLFDKSGEAAPVLLDRDKLQQTLAERLKTLAATFEMFQVMTTKELERGNPVEAMAYYQSSTLRPLVNLLNIKHRPTRHDFHTRYVYYELPREVVERLERLFYVKDAGDLGPKREEAAAWFRELLAEVAYELP